MGCVKTTEVKKKRSGRGNQNNQNTVSANAFRLKCHGPKKVLFLREALTRPEILNIGQHKDKSRNDLL